MELEEQTSNLFKPMTGEEDVATLIMCNLGCGFKRPLQPGLCANLWSVFI